MALSLNDLVILLSTKWSCERKHRHLLDIISFFIIFASLPEQFWGEAVITVV